MLEVQSIISRTYRGDEPRPSRRRRLRRLLDARTARFYEPGRLKTSRWAARRRPRCRTTARRRARSTRRSPRRSVFHADCGGHTAAAADVWGGVAAGYLLARPDRRGRARRVGHSRPVAHARTRAEQRCRAPASANGSIAIEIAKRDDSGRALERPHPRHARRRRSAARISGACSTQAFGVNGRCAARCSRSVEEVATSFVFTGKGFGHGVGLCQAGALARLRKGESPEAVLEVLFSWRAHQPHLDSWIGNRKAEIAQIGNGN